MFISFESIAITIVIIAFIPYDYSADRKFLQSMSLASITFVSNMDTSH